MVIIRPCLSCWETFLLRNVFIDNIIFPGYLKNIDMGNGNIGLRIRKQNNLLNSGVENSVPE